MQFGYVLLGLVTLTSIHTFSGQCSNGFPGVDRDNICCAASCGVCGGGGCSRRPGGSNNCCTSRIRDSDRTCSSTQPAPCIMQSPSICSNGLPGVQNGNICCDASCGTCGGTGCSRRPGGPDNCCVSRIAAGRVTCDTMPAPCIVNVPTSAPPTTMEPTTVAPTAVAPTTVAPTTVAPTTLAPTTVVPTTAAPTTAAPTTVAPSTAVPTTTCRNGFTGVQTGVICCDAGCGACGGPGCGGLPGGSVACCTGPVGASGMLCSVTMQAPCIVDN